MRRSGIIAIKLKKGDELTWVRLSSGKDEIMLVVTGGDAIRFPEKTVRSMGRATAGVTGMRIKKGQRIASLQIIPKEAASNNILIVTQHGYGKQTPLKEFRIQGRGGKGIRAASVTDKTGIVVSAEVITDQEDLIVLSKKGQIIKTAIGAVRVLGRATQGVKIMNLEGGDSVAGAISV